MGSVCASILLFVLLIILYSAVFNLYTVVPVVGVLFKGSFVEVARRGRVIHHAQCRQIWKAMSQCRDEKPWKINKLVC